MDSCSELNPQNLYAMRPSGKLVKRDLVVIIAIGVFASSIVLSSGLTELAKGEDVGSGILPFSHKGFLYDESSKVEGTGQVSIKGSFDDRAANFDAWMKGTGSINLESLRSMNKIGKMVEFNRKADLVFDGGQLKDRNKLASPLFENGIGASVNVRSNVSHIDNSEIEAVSSINRFNNALKYNTEVAFDGAWAITTTQGWSMNMNRSSQRYSGSFQIQKNIDFNDFGEIEQRSIMQNRCAAN
jgi:hypothetical protein